MSYAAPVTEQVFAIASSRGVASVLTGCEAEPLDADLVSAILEESGRLAAGVFAPLNRIGDAVGARLEAGGVHMPDGFAEAYDQYRRGGWASLTASAEHGGQGMPFVLGIAVQEQLASANLALSLCMMLGHGAVAALQAFGSDALKDAYLGRLVSGEWTGTMNLTEPQAGSDVGAVRTRATDAGDGTYRITGSKIFITFGDHGLAENIVHLVLARLPDAPPGTRGISLFLVPKILPDGTRNDIRVVSIEHKLGIHASPTCTMSYGDEGRCVGWLVGAEHQGMRAMFTMMNHARVNVGLQGVAIAERATQAAVAYALERVQGRRIIEHADVRRMVMLMRAATQAARAITYLNAAAVDLAEATGAPAAQGLADLLTPITKAYATDVGVEAASLAIQVHGGMGFVEDTGVAQHYRDARIAPIYEGTNGIQAMDLVSRKLPQGHWRALFDAIRAAPEAATGPLADALDDLEAATAFLMDHPDERGAAATPYLRMFGLVLGGYLLARQATEARAALERGACDRAFAEAKAATAAFYLSQVVPMAGALLPQVRGGAAALFALTEAQLVA